MMRNMLELQTLEIDRMRNRDVVLIIVSFCALIATMMFAITKTDQVEIRMSESVRVGQVWRVSYNKDNPFEDIKYDDKKIIAIQNGYIQYLSLWTAEKNKYLEFPISDTLSTSASLFIYNNHCIQGCE